MPDPVVTEPGTEPDFTRRVVSRRGEVVEFDTPEQAAEALARTDRSGRPLFSPDNSALREERRLRREYGDRPIAAGAAGAARGATFGLSDAAGNALGFEENLAALQRLNPEASMVGEVAGSVAPVLAFGGAGLAGEAVEGAGLLGRLGRAATMPARVVAGLGEAGGAAAGGLVRGAGTTALRRGLGTVTRFGVEGAIEGAASEGGRIISEAALGGDPDLTAQAIMARLGGGALYGAAGGAILGAGAGLVGEGVRATRRAAGGAADLLSRTWRDSVGTELHPTIARGWSLLSGGDAGDITRFTGLGAEGRRVRGILARGDDVYDAGTREIAGSLDGLERGRSHAADFWSRGLKRDQIVRRIDGERIADQAVATSEALARLRRHADDVVSNPALHRQGLGAPMRRLSGMVEAYERELAGAVSRGGSEGAADLFQALDQLKRELGPMVRVGRNTDPDLSALYEDLRTTLERSDLWGEAADVQRTVNRAFTEELGTRNSFRRRFLGGDGVRDDVDAFRTLDTTDTRTINAFLRQAGTVANETAEGTFEGTIGSTRNLLRVMDEHLDLPANVRADIAEALTSSERSLSRFNQIREEATILNQARRLSGATDSNARAVLGAATGMAMGGPLGAAAAALSTSPMIAVRALGTLERLQSGFSDQIGDTIRAFVSRGTRTGRRALDEGGRRARSAAIGGIEAYNARTRQMDEDARNPRGVVARMTARLDGLEAAPGVRNAMVATAARGRAYLAQHRPGGRSVAGSLRPEPIHPSQAEISAFLRRARAVDNPASVLEDMRRGDLTAEAVDALRAVYPRVYQEIRDGVTRAIAQGDSRLSYEDRLALGVLLGVPTDPALAPSQMAAIQAMYRSTTAAPGPAPRAGSTPNVAAGFASATDALAARRTA